MFTSSLQFCYSSNKYGVACISTMRIINEEYRVLFEKRHQGNNYDDSDKIWKSIYSECLFCLF